MSTQTANDYESKEDMDTSCDWLSQIEQQLHERDVREKIPFEHISISYNLLLDENVDLSKRCNDLSQAVLQLKQDNWNKPSLFMNPMTSNENTNNNDTSSDNKNDSNKSSKKNKKNKNNDTNNQSPQSSTYETEQLRNDNESLRKELMDVYRLKKENEEALSRLKKQSIENEELIINQTKSINELSLKHQNLLISHNDLKEGM